MMRNIFSRKKDKEKQPKFLQKTRKNFTDRIFSLFKNKKTLDSALLEELETIMLSADIGINAAQDIIGKLEKQPSHKTQTDNQAVFDQLKTLLTQQLLPVQKPLIPDTTTHKPYVILVLGVNGTGKTTTIGKLANYYRLQGKNIMLAAGDTFRAAAIEQLKIWGERNQIPVIAQKSGADSAAVIFDAVESAKAKKTDILIADTAGRLHTQSHLMDELKKIVRVIKKADETAPHEILLILDATTGQNALQQAKQFNEALKVTGIVLTKLDGTAKGGIIFAIAHTLGIPIRFIGVGEQIDDLKPFCAEDFVSVLTMDQQI